MAKLTIETFNLRRLKEHLEKFKADSGDDFTADQKEAHAELLKMIDNRLKLLEGAGSDEPA